MKKYLICCIFTIFSILILCTGCDTSGVSMPYSSAEYKNGDWTVEELVAHFEDLGFFDIEITNVSESFGEEKVGIYNVTVEDVSSDTLYTQYRAFDKGEELGTWLDVKIETYTLIPTLTTDNCTEFAELVQTDNSAPEKAELLASFMASHNKEYLEFDGTITDWYDEAFWVAVDIAIAVEDSNQLSFSWSTIDYSDLGLTGDYDFNNYTGGMISEGMQVHMIAKIVSSEDSWHLEIDSMQIIE